MPLPLSGMCELCHMFWQFFSSSSCCCWFYFRFWPETDVFDVAHSVFGAHSVRSLLNWVWGPVIAHKLRKTKTTKKHLCVSQFFFFINKQTDEQIFVTGCRADVRCSWQLCCLSVYYHGYKPFTCWPVEKKLISISWKILLFFSFFQDSPHCLDAARCITSFKLSTPISLMFSRFWNLSHVFGFLPQVRVDRVIARSASVQK